MASHRSICGCLRSAPEPSVSEHTTYQAWVVSHRDWQMAWARACYQHSERACLKRRRTEAEATRQAKPPTPPLRSIADLF